MRRLARRMQLAQAPSLDQYITYLTENQNEVQALVSDLLISVTCFFRDLAVFEALAKKVVLPSSTERTMRRLCASGCRLCHR